MLDPTTVLRCASEIRIQVGADGHLSIYTPEESCQAGPHGLAVLHAFVRPTRLSDGLAELQARIRGMHEWIELTNTLTELYRAGVLLDETGKRPVVQPAPMGFDTAGIHVAMLNDRVRTTRFLAGIREVVRPGDVVVDIGTGTGVLAIAAAQAGARHVYAVEETGIGQVAQTLFEANGVADRITLLTGRSTAIELPERADVLVSEIIGNEPLGEQVLEVFVDARTRLLKPDARMVPSALRICGLPVEIPEEKLARHVFRAEALENWRSWYGIDLDPLAMAIPGAPSYFLLRPQKARHWRVLAEPALLLELDLRTFTDQEIEVTRTVTATASGSLNGVLIYFELALGPTTTLSTNPLQVDPTNCWYSLVWFVADAPSVAPGDPITAVYRYRVPGPPPVEWRVGSLAPA